MATEEPDLPQEAQDPGEAVTRSVRVDRQRWFEWLVIFGTVLGIIWASAQSLGMVNERLDDVDRSIASLQQGRSCAIAATSGEQLAKDRANLLACLEQDTVRRRYLFSSLLVESRIWARYYACVAAFLLIAVGCVFIIMKVREDPHEVGAGARDVNFTFKSTSPGLAMTVLGSIILMTSLISPGEVHTKDSPAYLSDLFTSGAAEEGAAGEETLVNSLADGLPPPSPSGPVAER